MNTSPSTLQIDIDAPQGRITWSVPVTPMPGQSAATLAERIQEMLSILAMRKRYDTACRDVLTFREEQTLRSWESAYKKALAQEDRMDALLNKHLKAG